MAGISKGRRELKVPRGPHFLPPNHTATLEVLGPQVTFSPSPTTCPGPRSTKAIPVMSFQFSPYKSLHTMGLTLGMRGGFLAIKDLLQSP